MASIVFYFSGTGNSLSVAKALSHGTEPVNIARAKVLTYTADSIGFVYPSYCGEPPKPVKDFVEAASFDAGYIWAVVTNGGAPGNALGEVDLLLRQKGKKLDYGKEITLPDSVIILPTPDAVKKSLLETEVVRVKEISDAIEACATNTIGYSKLQKCFTLLTWFGFKNVLGTRFKKSTKKCFSCTQCAKMCPTNNISIKDGKAVFGKNCVYCFGCIQYCPNNAIRFGFIKRRKSSQYNHPEILAKEMIKRNK